MKFLYLDKKDLIRAWFTPKHTAMAVGILGVLLIAPFWRESVGGKFVLEPVNKAVVRAHVPGTITKIFVREGQTVWEGSPLATLSNLSLESGLDEANARLAMASAQTREAALQYRDYGNALMERERSSKQVRQSSEMTGALELKAPLTGTVVTPKVRDLLGTYLKTGSELLEIADLTELRARIYISEYDLYKVRLGESAKIQLDGLMGRIDGKVNFVTTRPVERPILEPEVPEKQENAGKPHQFYSVDILVENPEAKLRPGMTGVGRVYGARRSVGGLVLEQVKNFWGRKLW
jgi:multidrug resistance efflux pump